ncbi:cytochrome o ubiquinol oxidase subunit I [uncultured Shewanella sp.]|uniref:cytochrome o ubiquinol oxidase subunit I n=1 Tax=uncultured Shewanella sp. TaxID=173975 RepID=UPI00262B31D2|nr:cytochrome o ubiquinol oxidase subunit I [uncultured Shewanella sp.]
MLGKLTWDAVPWDNGIVMGAVSFMAAVVIVLALIVTRYGKWRYLWSEWFTTIDHKKIGIMYILVGFVMMLRGFSDAIMMRSQLALAASDPGYLPPEHYDQIFTAHGVIMIFFVAMPLVIGFINIVVPQQIGARDVAFPFMNSLSFWLFFVGMALVNMSLGIGDFARTGWLAYPPLSGIANSPGVGVDYYIWSLQIAGIGTLMTGINFFVTIMKMRCPGMTLMRMPIFTWTALCTNILIIAAFPVLTVTLALLTLDRYLGFHFFTATAGGDQMMYVNLIWIWGHPEVYILILPAFGVFSEVVPTFTHKKLFGYTSMVYATAVITVLSFSVWLHHFFTMGSGANVNAFFGIATMIIAIPTGVKIFNWLFTIYRGRLQMNLPIMWTLAFLSTFTIGGMTGVLLSVPGADFLLHNSLFLIAHFHNVIIGGVVFGMFAGYSYWFPKSFGFTLDEKWGKRGFWLWVIGFYLAFIPLYALGFMGMTRRLNHYDIDTGWQPLLLVAMAGAVSILLGIICQAIQLYVSIRDRELNRDTTGDPWNARTLEWSTSSPPALYNFPFTPVVDDIDAFWKEKQENSVRPKETRPYVDIHMPRNTGAGFIMSAFALVFGFAMIWHIWWLACVGIMGIFVAFIHRCFEKDVDYYIPAAEVEAIEKLRSHNV